MQLRRAHASDCQRLTALHNASLPQCWSEHDFLTWVQDARYHLWVAEQQDAIVGYLVARVIEDEAEIIAIAVDTAHRRKGIAKALLLHMQQALDVTNVFLEVSKSNEAALRLYEGLGFAPLGVRLHYYADGTDALAMQWGSSG